MPTNGFEITQHEASQMLRLRLWGRWNAALGKTYLAALREQLAEIRRRDTAWLALIDLMDWGPPSQSVPHILHEQTEQLRQYGIQCIAYLSVADTFPDQCLVCDDLSVASFTCQDDALRWLFGKNNAHTNQ